MHTDTLQRAAYRESVLRPTVMAPRLGRRLVRSACDDGAITGSLADDAALVLSELIVITLQDRRFSLKASIRIHEGAVTLRVFQEHAVDVAPMAAEDATSLRRGWDIVRGLSQSWGHSCTDRGREVWATLRRRSPADGT